MCAKMFPNSLFDKNEIVSVVVQYILPCSLAFFDWFCLLIRKSKLLLIPWVTLFCFRLLLMKAFDIFWKRRAKSFESVLVLNHAHDSTRTRNASDPKRITRSRPWSLNIQKSYYLSLYNPDFIESSPRQVNVLTCMKGRPSRNPSLLYKSIMKPGVLASTCKVKLLASLFFISLFQKLP